MLPIRPTVGFCSWEVWNGRQLSKKQTIKPCGRQGSGKDAFLLSLKGPSRLFRSSYWSLSQSLPITLLAIFVTARPTTNSVVCLSLGNIEVRLQTLSLQCPWCCLCAKGLVTTFTIVMLLGGDSRTNLEVFRLSGSCVLGRARVIRL